VKFKIENREKSVGDQNDGTSCGVFTTMKALHVLTKHCRPSNNDFNQSDVISARVYMAHVLMTHRSSVTNPLYLQDLFRERCRKRKQRKKELKLTKDQQDWITASSPAPKYRLISLLSEDSD
jgi:hypothetical protein